MKQSEVKQEKENNSLERKTKATKVKKRKQLLRKEFKKTQKRKRGLLSQNLCTLRYLNIEYYRILLT